MNWNSKLLKHLNFYIPILVAVLIIFGLLAISSAVELNKHDSNATIFLSKQILSVILGIMAILILQLYDYRIFKNYVSVIYISTVSILLLILLFGQTVAGGKRWIILGPLNFQPSELAKILFILVLAAVLDKNQDNLKYLTGLIKPFIYMLIPFILIVLQNDLGTSLVLIVIFIAMLYIGGGNIKFLSIIFGGGFGIIILLIAFHYFFGTPLPYLQEYQLNRLIVFLNPGIDPYGSGYNIIQSKIAVGSGELFGKGFFAGTQNQLNFLPEKHTDFIFSVIGEEFGFIGVLTLIFTYLLLLWQLINVAQKARDNYGRLVVTGIVAMFFFHILENIGMTMGVMPITGIPLPFVSYGGSSMVASLIGIGLVINVNLRRKKILF